MLVQCPLSGVQYKLTTMPSAVVTALHPITSMALAQLNELQIPADQIAARLYLCGYLHKLHEQGLLKYGNIPISARFSAQWIMQQANNIVRVANWLELNPSHNAAKKLPAFRLSSQTTPVELQEWITECGHIIDLDSGAWTSKREIEKVRRLLDAQYPQDRGDRYEAGEDRELADQRARRVPAITRGRYLLTWVHESFGNSSIISLQQFQQIKDVLKNTGDYPFPVLQQVKAFVLDFGLERSIEQKNEKDTVIARIDDAMVKKVGVAALLSSPGPRNISTKDSPKGVAAYTVLSDIPSVPAVPSTRIDYTIPVPATEPKVTDYPNRLAYSVAAKKWREARAATRTSAR